MSKATKGGCARHLLISGGVMLLLSIVLIVLNWGTFSLMFSNMLALGEGANIAEEMQTPDDLLSFVAERPEHASLVVFDVGEEEEGIFFGADEERPIMNVYRLLLLAAYGAAVEAGEIDPDERLALDELRRFHLEARGQGGHRAAVERLRDEGLIEDDSLSIASAVRGAVQFNDEAAADWLLLRLGEQKVDELREAMGWSKVASPLPSSGQVLSWSHPKMEERPGERVESLRGMDRETYRSEVFALTEQFIEEGSFREEVLSVIRDRGTEISLRDQRNLAIATQTRGTAREYASFLADALQGQLVSDSVSRFIHASLDRQVGADTLARPMPVERIGAISGSFPGVVSFAGYARRPDPLPDRVVVFFMEEVPIAVFYHLMQTGMDRALQVRLLSDDAYVEEVKSFLDDSAG